MENTLTQHTLINPEIDSVRVSFLNYLNNNPELLNNIIEEIIEDKGMANAIEEGLMSENSTFEEVYSILGVWKVQKIIKETFIKDIKNLDDDKLKLKLGNVIKQIESTEHLFLLENVKKLNGYNKYYRIKVGNYRIGIYYDQNIIFLVRFLHRKEIYRYFP